MYTDRFTRDDVLDAALAAAFVLAWSSGFIGATLGARAGSVITLLMWRFLLVVPALALFSGAWGGGRAGRGGRRAERSGRRAGRRELAVQALLGLLSQGVYLGGTVLAVGLGVSAGTAALVAALQPIAAAALAGPVLGERVSRRQWYGLIVGLIGVAVVVGGDLGAGTAPAWAYALPFAGMAGLVAATLLERRLRPVGSVTRGLAVQSATSAVIFTGLAVCAGRATPPADVTFWVAVAWTIVLSTFGGYGLYWLNLRRGSVTRVSSLIYLTPPTTLIWALVMFGQPITAGAITGLAVCLVGVLLAREDGGYDRRIGQDGSEPVNPGHELSGGRWACERRSLRA